jgi:hypothetical protein
MIDAWRHVRRCITEIVANPSVILADDFTASMEEVASFKATL